MTARKLFALLLSLLLLLCPLLASCGSTQSTEDTSSTAGTTSDGTESTDEGGGEKSKYLDENGMYTLENIGMPEFNFNYDTFTVCVYSNAVQDTYHSEEIEPIETTDDALRKGVLDRNGLIEEQYGVTVKAFAVDNVVTTLQQDVAAGTATYDAAMPFMGHAASLAQDGNFYNLYDFKEYIHLDAPWWDQDANENLSLAGKLYFTTGDISIMQKVVSSAILFNKELYDEICYDTYGDLYQMVRDGKWTFDVMHEMGIMATMEKDGENGMSFNDQWGMVGTNGIGGMYIASGNKLIVKDHNDIPQIALGSTEFSILYAEKVLEVYQDDSWFINTQKIEKQWNERNVWEAAMGAFGNKRSLFCGSAFSALKKLRAYDVDSIYGIVPLPKASVEQDKYYTPASVSMAYGICIPVNVPDAEFSAYMIEALACGGKNFVTPAYYEVALKSRAAKDDGSEEMLDLIFSNVVYDLGSMYNFGGIDIFGELIAGNSTAVASKLDSIRSTVQADIDAYVMAYELND